MLPDKSVLKQQNLVENAKMPKFKCVILSEINVEWVENMNKESLSVQLHEK